MKAVVQDGYGAPADVLTIGELEPPAIGDDDVLVRVRAASINPADWHFVRGEPLVARFDFGLRGPKAPVPGCDVAGHVEAVGRNVESLQPGDEVFGSPFGHGLGAFAELAAVPESCLAPKPENLSLEQAATVPLAGLTAVQALRDHGRVEPGDHVLIAGASGGVGSFAVQIAKALGAEVTGVCSGANVDLVRSLGADHVIDYTDEDFTEGGRRYDLVVQLAGGHSPSRCRRVVAPDGTLLVLSGDAQGRWFGPIGRVLGALVLSPFVSQKLANFTVKIRQDDLHYVRELIEADGVKPVVDRTYPLSDVPDAIAHVEQGHTRGKVAVTV